MTARDLIIDKVSGEFDREDGIRQACNVFGYDREDFEDQDEYQDDSDPLSDDIGETDYDGDGI